MNLGPIYIPFSLDLLSVALGFILGCLFWWFLGNLRPVFDQMRATARENREEKRARTSTPAEDSYRKLTYRRVQGLHLAASLFSLDEIVRPVRLVAPPPFIEPGMLPYTDDVVSAVVPYLPTFPELAATYHGQSLTLGQALLGGMNLVLTGQPGTGKTVALAQFASQIVNRDPAVQDWHTSVPVLVHVADLNLPPKNPNDLLGQIIDVCTEGAPILALSRLPPFLQAAFASNRVLLLLDGVDELSPTDLQLAVDYLKLLFKAFPKLRVVTTGSLDHLGGLIGLGFVPMTVMPWNEVDQVRFVEAWSALWTKYVAVEAWAQAGYDPVESFLLNQWILHDNNIGLTPLEFTLKVWGVYAGDLRGPRAMDAIETHLRRISPQNTPTEAMQILAMQSFLTAQPVFDSRKAREWVRRFEPAEESASSGASEGESAPASTEPGDSQKPASRKKGKQAVVAPSLGILSKMVDSGLLSAHISGQMRFVHFVFGGFLAGQAMSSYGSPDRLLSQPSWGGRNLAMRYTAAFGDASALLDGLLQHEDHFFERPVLTAARWLRDAPRQAAWRARVMNELIRVLQNSVAPFGLRGQALAAFAFSADPGVAALFRQLMEAPAPELRQLAALGSGAIQDIKAVDLLVQCSQDGNPGVRRASCLALVAIGSPAALEAVATVLLRGDEDQRRAAAEALANHPVEGHATLRDGATSLDILLRRSVVYGLARIDEPWAVQILERMQVEDDQWVVRNSASEILESRQQMNPRIPRRPSAPAETPWIIELAGRFGMGVTPGKPATDLMLLALKSGEHEEQMGALAYLRHTPTEGVIGVLYGGLYSGNYEMREAAFNLLADFASSGMTMPDPQQFGLG